MNSNEILTFSFHFSFLIRIVCMVNFQHGNQRHNTPVATSVEQTGTKIEVIRLLTSCIAFLTA